MPFKANTILALHAAELRQYEYKTSFYKRNDYHR